MTITSLLDLEREAELRAYAVLDSDTIPALEHIADLAAAATGMAVAEVNVVSLHDVVHVATTNRDHLRVPREHSFCSTVITYDTENYVVPDARLEQPFASSPYVNGEKAAIRSYASALLTAPSGVVLGTICVFDSELRDVSASQLGTLRTLAATIVDVLEMRRVEVELAGTLARLAGSHRELNTSNESLEAFAGQISHDIKTPLTSMRLALELLADSPNLAGSGGASDELFLLDRAVESAGRMNRMIEDLMAFASLGGNELGDVDTHQVASEVLTDLISVVGDADVVLGGLPHVWSTPSQVRAILQNLIANALKFASQGPEKPVIKIDGFLIGENATIRIADNGPGVPAAERDSVFDLLVRGSNAEVDGHGIGLATCARIVAAHGGDIWVDDSPGGGATFWFSLPTGPAA